MKYTLEKQPMLKKEKHIRRNGILNEFEKKHCYAEVGV